MLHSAYGAAGGAALSAEELAVTLRRYEAARAPRAHAVAKRANDVFTMGVGEGGWFARLKRDALFWLMPVPVLQKAGAWILRFPEEHCWGSKAAEEAAAAPAAA